MNTPEDLVKTGMSVDEIIERALRLGPPDEASYPSRLLTLDAAQPVGMSVRVRPGSVLGAGPRALPVGLPGTRLAWASILVALLALAVAVGLVGGRLPRPIGNGKLAYIELGGGMQPQGDIFILDPAAPGGRTNLTASPELHESEPQWSPAGRWIAFLSRGMGGTERVFVIDPAGQNDAQLADVECAHIAWLATEDTLLCGTLDTIWLVPLDGGTPRGLRPQLNGGFAMGDVSPDGTKLLLETAWWGPGPEGAPEPAHNDLYVLDLASGGLRQLTRDESGWKSQARWAPSGALVAFSTRATWSGWPTSIEVVSGDGTGRRVLVTPAPNVTVRSPVWTPDGGHVLFELLSTESSRPDGIWIVRADGSEVGPFAAGMTIAPAGRTSPPRLSGFLTDAAWSPDGKLLIVKDLQETRRTLFTIDREGANLTELLDCLCAFDWQPIQR